MSYTIQQLKSKWKKEKESYKRQEVGTGVQSFVKDVLECEDLFGLKEGKLSTKLLQRKKEFIHEKRVKEQRSADFVIFISPEILIPIEVELYGHIKGGIEQLFKYQKDLDKKYGILTDGYTWRFYNNNIFKTFNLDEILSDPALFRDFWIEYTKPEYYYLSFFEEVGQLTIFKDIEKLHVEQHRVVFFEDITALIRSFKNKLKIEGYFEGLEKNDKEKKAIEITYAYIIQFILYKTLVDNDYNNYGPSYQKKVDAIHKHIKENNFKAALGIIDGISTEISKNIYRPFAEEQDFIRHKLLQLYQSVENKLADVSPWLDIFVFIKKYNYANVQNEIFGYIYENYLKELYEDEKKGQYFTDPAIVNFMLDQIGYTNDKLKVENRDDKNNISLIDPACGSGTFLYSAVDAIIKAVGEGTEAASKKIEELINNNIFGLDIAEFPLYLAEMSILMRLLPLIISERYNNPIDKKIKVFKTKDSLSEFLDTAIRNTINDIDVEGGQQKLFSPEKLDLGYSSYVRDPSDLEEMKRSVENLSQCPRRRFDYVIGNPPYVGYNECSKQGVLIFELLKKGKVKLNNIYGLNLHSIPDNRKKYAPKPNLYAFFIALGVALLKDSGKLCYIIPQTILTSDDHDVLRYHLAKYITIHKIITFSGKMFIGRGLKQDKPVATSSLIFVISKHKPSVTHEVEIINYKYTDDEIEETLRNIMAGKRINKKHILQGKLLQNVANWNFIKQEKSYLEFYEEYKRGTDDISIYYDHVLAGHHFKSRFYFDKGLVFPKNKIIKKDEAKSGNYYYLIDLSKERYRATLTDLVVEKQNIKIPHGSQGFTVFDKRYKILWGYMNYDHFYFCDDNIMISFNYVIISSDNKSELLYLLSLLNSPIVNLIIERNLRSESEKDILLGIKNIKKIVRTPKITIDNQYIKDEIVDKVEEMLKLEDANFSDLVDFSGVMMQKFNEVKVEGDNLILVKDNNKTKCKIVRDVDLVRQVINTKYKSKGLLKEEKISLSELKSLPAINYRKQIVLKEYIDDLVFALYFSVQIGKIGLNRANPIRTECKKHKYYGLLEK